MLNVSVRINCDENRRWKMYNRYTVQYIINSNIYNGVNPEFAKYNTIQKRIPYEVIFNYTWRIIEIVSMCTVFCKYYCAYSLLKLPPSLSYIIQNVKLGIIIWNTILYMFGQCE